MLLGDVLVVLLAVGFVWLGRWQWGRAHEATGGFQNYLYAVQWWLFCCLGVVGWARTVLEVARNVPQAQRVRDTAHPARVARITLPTDYRLPRYPSLTVTKTRNPQHPTDGSTSRGEPAAKIVPDDPGAEIDATAGR